MWGLLGDGSIDLDICRLVSSDVKIAFHCCCDCHGRLSFVVVYRGLVKAESGSDTVLNGFQLMVFHMTDAVRESGFIDVCHLIAHSN